MPALLYGMETWIKLSKAEIQQLEQIQDKALKMTFNLPIAISYVGLIIATEKRIGRIEQNKEQAIIH